MANITQPIPWGIPEKSSIRWHIRSIVDFDTYIFPDFYPNAPKHIAHLQPKRKQEDGEITFIIAAAYELYAYI
jgi:hypothetical protein